MSSASAGPPLSIAASMTSIGGFGVPVGAGAGSKTAVVGEGAATGVTLAPWLAVVGGANDFGLEMMATVRPTPPNATTPRMMRRTMTPGVNIVFGFKFMPHWAQNRLVSALGNLQRGQKRAWLTGNLPFQTEVTGWRSTREG